jgi:hypothetical protein
MSRHTFNNTEWAKLDIFNQMGNIGSEVSRALNAKEQGKHERMMAAFYRGVDLMNATIDAWSERGYLGSRELLIAREQFGESILGNNIDSKLENYFNQFAVAAKIRQY